MNQFSMDYDGNLARTCASCAEAVRRGAAYRLGPELELTGYGCEDHFLEADTEAHAWESLAALLSSGATDGLVVDTGLPVTHCGVRYNCRALLLDRRVLLLRPKLALADDGNYREGRWFTAWQQPGVTEPHPLPECVRDVTGQTSCPLGDAGLAFDDATLAVELCEELFVPLAPHARAALSGADVIANGSGSHTQLRKLQRRVELIRGATAGPGGAYLYANQRGCDGGRLYYDGCACIALNGDLVAQGEQFSLVEVEVVVATLDLDEVTSHRGAFSALRTQAAQLQPRLPFLPVPDFRLCGGGAGRQPALPRAPRFLCVEEEIALGPACWLWDYLRRSGAAGYLLPLSGGADSSATAAIVGSMCQLALAAARSGDAQVCADVRRLAALPADAPLPAEARELAGALLSTLYMGTVNSGAETRRRAQTLAAEIGAQHLAFEVDAVCAPLLQLFSAVTGSAMPRFAVDGGSSAEHLALQNIQARVRMVTAFLFAQLLPWTRRRPGGGFLLVLGSANVDECLRGYLTKYDCSSADVNPIGAISKADLRLFLKWGATHLGYPCLAEVESAPPSAELTPRRGGVEQTDEEDMGMSYDELGVYGRLRKMSRCGPVSMFRKLRSLWGAPVGVGAGRGLSAAQVADKVKRFFRFYAANRHKSTTLTPAYHAESYSPDDNRFDLRQFLYNTAWPRQFAKIDAEVADAMAS